MFTVKNNLIQITADETGAELTSLKSLKSEVEYLWDADPDVWASHAPNLFPVIGCLKEDGFLYRNREYKCPKHGFIRNNKDISLIGKTDDSLTFSLKYNDEYLKIFPFKFEYQIKYILAGNELFVEHQIVNHGDGEMLFSLGGHPGFKCPIHEDENYNDYYLEFEEEETAQSWRVQGNGLIGEDTHPVFDEPKKINLHPHLFDNDALILKNLNSNRVSLKSRKSDQVLIMSFEDFQYLGIWAKPGAEFVCIEPWLGIADSRDSDRNFETKEGLIKLRPKKIFNAAYSIAIEEKNTGN